MCAHEKPGTAAAKSVAAADDTTAGTALGNPGAKHVGFVDDWGLLARPTRHG